MKRSIIALTVMMNGYSDNDEAPITLGLQDSDETVRDFARGVCAKLSASIPNLRLCPIGPPILTCK